MSDDKARLFLAIDIPKSIRSVLYDLGRSGLAGSTGLKWVEESNIHLTLKFLGDVSRSQIDAIQDVLEDITCPDSIGLEIRGLGIFGNLRRPRVLWAGVSGDIEALRLLHQEVEDKCARLGFDRDVMEYRPHVTLARFKESFADTPSLRRLLGANNDVSLGSFIAESMVLYQSTLLPSGPVYTPVKTFNLTENKD